MEEDNSRIQILNDLLFLKRDLKNIENELNNFEWDSEELIKLSKNHVESILKKFLNKEISNSEIEKWANIIELRDDIDYSDFSEMIDELANPILYSELTELRALGIINN